MSVAPCITIPNDFNPRPYQVRFMRRMDEGCLRAVIVWHRRAGKDLTALHHTCKKMLQRMGGYWHIFPTAEQGRKAIWEGFTKDGVRILEQVFPAAIRKSPKTFSVGGEMVVTLINGSIWRLMGSDKMDVVGAGPVGVVFSEYSLAKPNTWDLIRPMLRENGGWAVFAFTPRGKNHGFRIFEMAMKDADWFADLQTLNTTRAYDPEATVREEKASGMPPSLIQQEYFCAWDAANVGSYYGELLAELNAMGRMDDFPIQRQGIHTTWDLGRSDNTSIWFWRLAPDRLGVEFVDHYSASGKSMRHYFKVIRDRRLRYGYEYATHWLPHDARAKTLATESSILEQCVAEWGASHVEVVPQLGLQDGIQALRELLQGSTRFHPRCRLTRTTGTEEDGDLDGLSCLEDYHRAWNDSLKAFSDGPVHAWSSHTADAARYVACVWRIAESRQRPPAPPPPLVVRKPTVNEVLATVGGPRREHL